MKSRYDNIAAFYDRLARLVFGNAILHAHRFLADAIPAKSCVLIVGGGTGFILEEIAKKHKGGLQITYVDISGKMIELSEKRNAENNTVLFINESILEVELPGHFDVVVTPFFLDNFLNNTAEVIFKKIDTVLKPQSLWLFADFEISKKSKWWQKILLKTMYFFFKAFCGIEASRLPETNSLFRKNKYLLIAEKSFYKNFISAVIYSKLQDL